LLQNLVLLFACHLPSLCFKVWLGYMFLDQDCKRGLWLDAKGLFGSLI
jgi:hypothetical protein